MAKRAEVSKEAVEVKEADNLRLQAPTEVNPGVKLGVRSGLTQDIGVHAILMGLLLVCV